MDVGDTIPLSWQTTDAAGQPASVGVASLTLTLPDGSTVNPALVNPSTGSYQPASPFIATQAGRHEVLWQGTGANAQTTSDVFEVLAPDPGLLVSVAGMRSSLRLPGGQTASDDEIHDLIAAATPVMEDICGAILQRPFDDWLDGGSPTIHLMDSPLISVAFVRECYGAGYVRELSLQNLDAGSFDTFGYTVDLTDGVLYRRVSGMQASFAYGRRNIHVGGIKGRAVIRPNITRASRRLIRWLWQSEMQGGRPASGTGAAAPAEGVTISTPSGYRVPLVVVQLCGDDARIPGMG